MQEAADAFVGLHDYRNFCRVDTNGVGKFIRRIYQFKVEVCPQSKDVDPANDMCQFEVRIRFSRVKKHHVLIRLIDLWSILFMASSTMHGRHLVSRGGNNGKAKCGANNVRYSKYDH